jgi:hypothetical protein
MAIVPLALIGKRNSMRLKRRALIAVLSLLAVTATPQEVFGYGTFTHEELIDLVWNGSIRPLLLDRYPGISESGLRVAHSYAYGGCLIQDLGYYPFGKQLFSDLTHYVRSGDFVLALLRDAQNVNDYAFAIGALSHYVGDSIGHSEGINPSTAITFPELEKQYGPIVTYEESPTSHVRTEFGFDVAQTARLRYAPFAYRQQIGLRVSRTLLERAFFETYGLTVRSILGPPRAAMDSYRVAVRRVIPLFASGTIVNVGSHLPPALPSPELQHLSAAISQTDYARYWSQYQRGPTLKDHLLGIVVRLIPKIGILRILAIEPPSSQTEDLFVKSLDAAVTQFQDLLAELSRSSQGQLTLANRDLDTGAKVRPGAYRLTDRAYAQLLRKVTENPGLPIPAGLRQDILAYYADPDAPISTKKNRKAWKNVLARLEHLKLQAPSDIVQR